MEPKTVLDNLLINPPDYFKKIHCDIKPWTMSLKCAVASCRNEHKPDVQYPYKFHKFPLQDELCKKWLERCGLPSWIDAEHMMVCSDHFSLDDYERNYREEFNNPNYRRKLKATAFPAQNLKDYDEPYVFESTGDTVLLEAASSTTIEEVAGSSSVAAPTTVVEVAAPTTLEDVKAAVDENEMLTKMLQELKEKEAQLRTQLKQMDKRVDFKQQKLRQLQRNSKILKRTREENQSHKSILSTVFTDAQVNVLRGKKKTVWSDDDLAMAFSLRQMSSKECYLYLKYTLNIPLPALSCISCAVYGCENSTLTNTDPLIHYYYFPKHPVIAQQWLDACIWKDQIDINKARICSIHFGPDSYSTDYKMLEFQGGYIKMLKHDAIPTLAILQPASIIKTTDLEMQCDKTIIYGVEGDEYIYTDASDTAEIVVSNFDIKIEPSIVEYNSVIDEKYRNISDVELEQIKKQNEELKLSIEKCHRAHKDLEIAISRQRNTIQELDEIYKETYIEYNHLWRGSLNDSEQTALLKKVFSESQIKILMGKKKIYWSNDDMAVGYTIRHMSSKRCYMYLTKNLNIPLPALSSIKRWATLKKNDCDKDVKSNDVEKIEDDSE